MSRYKPWTTDGLLALLTVAFLWWTRVVLVRSWLLVGLFVVTVVFLAPLGGWALAMGEQRLEAWWTVRRRRRAYNQMFGERARRRSGPRT